MKQRNLKQRKPDPPEERFPKEQEVARTPSSNGGGRPLYYYVSYDNYYYKKNSRNNDSTENILPSKRKKKRRKSNFRKSCLLTICIIISISFFSFLHVYTNHEENYILHDARTSKKHASENYQSSSLLTAKTKQSDMKRSEDDVSHHVISKEKKAGSITSEQFQTKAESIDKPAPIKTPTAAIPHDTKEKIEIKKVLPAFSNLPSPTSHCHPNVNNATHSNLISYCNITNCMQHKKEDLLLLDKSGEAAEQGSCKMLWFAAMHESEEECSESSIANSKRHSYFVDYSVALNSALRNAHDTLQPVLMLGRYGMSYENSTEPKKLGRWAKAKGKLA